MEKIKLKNKKTDVVKEINKTIAGDYLGTNEWIVVENETKEVSKSNVK